MKSGASGRWHRRGMGWAAAALCLLLCFSPGGALAHHASNLEPRLVAYTGLSLGILEPMLRLMCMDQDELLCQWRRIPPRRLLAVLSREFETGLADTVVAAEPQLLDAGRAGLLLPYLPQYHRNLRRSAIGEKMRHLRIGYAVAAVAAVGPASSSRPLRWRSWRELISGRVGRVWIVGSDLARTLFADTPVGVARATWVGWLEGTKVVPQIARALEAAARSGGGIVVASTTAMIHGARRRSLPLSWRVLREPFFQLPLAVALIQGTRRPNSAIALVDQLLTRRSALIMAWRFGLVPVRLDLDRSLLPRWMWPLAGTWASGGRCLRRAPVCLPRHRLVGRE